MSIRNEHSENEKKASDFYDMTEDASKTLQPDGGTEQGRLFESDDINEESTQGPVSSPAKDNWGENKIATSLDDEC